MLRPVVYSAYLLRFSIGYEFVWLIVIIDPYVLSVILSTSFAFSLDMSLYGRFALSLPMYGQLSRAHIVLLVHCWILGITVSSRCSDVNTLWYFVVHVGDFREWGIFTYARI